MSQSALILFPLSLYYDSFWPKQYFSFSDVSFLNQVWIEPLKVSSEGNDIVLETAVEVNQQVEFSLPAFDAIAFTFGGPDNNIYGRFKILLNSQFICEVNIPVNIKIKNFLKPVIYQDGKYVAQENPLYISILDSKLIFNLILGELSFSSSTINVPNCMIGDTGVIFAADNFRFLGSLFDPKISFDSAKIILPDFFIIPPNTEIILSNAEISSIGFSGSCSIDIPLTASSTIFGIPGGLKHVEIKIENNQPVTFNLEGQLLIPYFDKPVDVKFDIGNGNFSVQLLSVGGGDITLTKDELLALHIQSMGGTVNSTTNKLELNFSGGIEPLLFAKDGVQWPRMDVKDLRINSNGEISIAEAWLDLKDMVNVDLWGFHFELRKIGIGTTQDKKMWVDISGAVKLIEQLPLGLDVEGFRIAWPGDLKFDDPNQLVQKLQKIEIQFAGVEINFAMPAVVKIDGLIRFFKEAQKVGFAGDMKLAVIPAGFSAEAGLMVGMNFEEPAFPFLYVYFGFESSAGIPLAQTGLALKGAIGLIGMNVAPNKTPEQNWYYDWYKGAPEPGVQQTTKWTDKRNAFAIGIGVTISTADGIVKSTKGLLVLAVPGPILVIEGKAILLNPSGEGEGPFGALAVFDGNEGTVQFNIEAQAELVKDMIDAHAGVEAFFDFKDLSNWHLYLGQDEPGDRRIRANVMDIMTADAYLMLDMIDADTPHMRMGVSAKIEPPIPDLTVTIAEQKIGIEIDAWFKLDGNGEVSIHPEQFAGNLDIDGELSINALGIEFSISGYVHTDFEGPVPFSLAGELGYKLDLPWPLPSYSGHAAFDLEIPADPVLEISNPVLSVALFSRFTNESKGANLVEGIITNNSTDKPNAQKSPVVEVDINPVIAFDQQMNDPQGVSFLMDPGPTKSFNVGEIKLTPGITSVKIFEKKKNEHWGNGFGSIDSTAHLIYSTAAIGTDKELKGVWLAESDPQSPANPASRKLQLLTGNPLINTTHAMQMEAMLFLSELEPQDHLSQLLLEDYPGLMFAEPEKPRKRCVYFERGIEKYQPQSKALQKIPAQHLEKISGLTFRSTEDFYIGKLKYKETSCFGLYANKYLNITFPEEIIYCTISYCKISHPENLPEEKIESIFKKEMLAKKEKPADDFKPSIKYLVVNKKPDHNKYIIVDSYDGIPEEGNLWYQFPAKDDISKKKYFTKILMASEEIFIQSICYLTKADYENYQNAKDVFGDNLALMNNNFGDSIRPYLNPGCYYKMVVETLIDGDADTGPFEDALKAAFNNATSKTFSKTAYFQTDSPPANLQPYTKWTYPNQDMNRVFCNDEFAVCFKRDYLQDIFDGSADQLKNFKIEASVLDVKNNLIRYNTAWHPSGGFTLFPDEQTWEQYINDNHLPATQRKEDILSIYGNGSLLPNQKYNLLLTGGDGGQVFIPQKLPMEEINKFWNLDGAGWIYTDDLELKKNGTGEKKLISVKNSFENTEIAFEVKGDSLFGVIFRHKLTTDGREVYYRLNFIKRSGAQKVNIDFISTDGINPEIRETISYTDEFRTLEWKKFKIKIVATRVKVYCFDKILTEPDGFNLLLLATETAGQIVPANNINGSVGLCTSSDAVRLRNIVVRNSELMRIPFYTTGFNTLASMITPAGNAPVITIVESDVQILDNILPSFNTKYAAIPAARLNLYRSVIDNEYGMAKYTQGPVVLFGREAVEKYRIDLRQLEKQLDDFFNEQALNILGGLFFDKAKKGIEIFGIRAAGICKAIYIKSPEKLFPKFDNTKDPYARTKILLKLNGSDVSKRIFNSDGDHVIFYLSPGIQASGNNEITIEFSYVNDFDDDNNSSTFFETSHVKHHRYDRAFRKRTSPPAQRKFEEKISFTVKV